MAKFIFSELLRKLTRITKTLFTFLSSLIEVPGFKFFRETHHEQKMYDEKVTRIKPFSYCFLFPEKHFSKISILFL